MFGLTNYVIVIVVNNLSVEDKRRSNYFDVGNIRVATNCALQDTIGNPHAKSDIQKQAYNYLNVPDVKSAFGLTGTNFTSHSAYRAGKILNLNDLVNRKDEIVIIRNGLDVNLALQTANRFRILPERYCN